MAAGIRFYLRINEIKECSFSLAEDIKCSKCGHCNKILSNRNIIKWEDENFMYCFKLKTHEQAITFNRRLCSSVTQMELNKRAMVKLHLEILNAEEAIKTIFHTYFEEDLLAQYSWEGDAQKLPFTSLNGIIECIMGAACEIHNNFNITHLKEMFSVCQNEVFHEARDIFAGGDPGGSDYESSYNIGTFDWEDVMHTPRGGRDYETSGKK
ncbi:uncharacterized protein LOC119684016 [Teleopsis dalmanni]|uniref:uncharacterized protein LOC119682818 n=1 Tax=Teleopsis dalmanni TaxID=139649 RepID=UPI000D32BFFD|nr:uncharacterized protein LOC119682818 [Teleopsis dalmanni]XP_037952303.1 uncharacterized protein LOC119682850 [Teleopsis dalmanni]XP_037953875.1 uncharacterized protein LOC119684016 [Teleopsis dalmanni]